VGIGACENCGTRVGVEPVTYTHEGQWATQALCPDCKDLLLGRRRTRGERTHRKRRGSSLARLSDVLREGGALAYVGVGLFALGVVLVPLLILLSLLTR
jgi:hypothetical protein